MLLTPQIDPVSYLFKQYKGSPQAYPVISDAAFKWAYSERSQTELANIEYIWADLQAQIYNGLQQGILKPSVLSDLRPVLFNLVQSHLGGDKKAIIAAESECAVFFKQHSHHQYYKTLVNFSLMLLTTSLLLYFCSFAAFVVVGESVFPEFAFAALTSSWLAMYGAVAEILGLVHINKIDSASENVVNSTLYMSHELNRFFSARPQSRTAVATEVSMAKSIRAATATLV